MNGILNESLSYIYEWYNDSNILIGSGPSIENLPAGTYRLGVSVNGCVSSPALEEFTIEEPSTIVGTISETCDGNISFPINVSFTPTQLNQVGIAVRAELFTRDASNAYTISFGTQTFNAATASETLLKTGSDTPSISTFCPPLPGVTPPTILVPDLIILAVCLVPSEPVIP